MMTPRYFVVLAGMRTGSNLLEEHLASVPGITMHGELFNPHFFGKPKRDAHLGQTMDERDADPLATLERMITQSDDLPGFRLFQDHDPRVLTHVLSDPTCAKIVLTRRAIDSFVSLQIARTTGQWWLGDARSARTAQIDFDPDAYAEFTQRASAFITQIDATLQATGQTAFRLTYADLSTPDTITGLIRFLHVDGNADANAIRARVQNPTPVADRLTNPEAARDALAAEAADIGNPPVFEPDRGPGMRYFRAGTTVPLLYMPIRGAWDDPVPAWLAQTNGSDLLSDMTQRDLRRWKRQHPGHLSYTVLRHPLPRVHDAFCRHILPTDQDNYAHIRHALIRRYSVPLPPVWPAPDWSLDAHRAAFFGFLKFLKANLAGQTSLRVDNTWATQERLLSAIATLVVPDRVLRENDLQTSLKDIAKNVGAQAQGKLPTPADQPLHSMSDVATDNIQKAAEAAYRRDYMMFGFGPWEPPAA